MTKRDAADMPATQHQRMKTNKMQSSANSRGDTCGGTQTTNLPVKSPAKMQFPRDCIHSDFHCSLLEVVELINTHGVPVKSEQLLFFPPPGGIL